MNEEKGHILIVDDEEDICEILRFNLESEGYHIDVVNSAEEALSLDLKAFDLLLLDVMMGQTSGFKMAEIMKHRPDYASIPIIFITAKNTENDTITGLSLGADDYIQKPFSIKEVSLRVSAVLHRTKLATNKPRQSDILSFKDLVIGNQQKKATYKGEELQLTKKEFDLLSFLLAHPDHVYSRDEILEQVWESDAFVIPRTVDVNVARLRKKLKDYGPNIVSRLGYGYCFNTDL